MSTPDRWTLAELERVLADLGPDLAPREWAERSGRAETEVRIALGIVLRREREALGWTLGMAAVRAGVSRGLVGRAEAGEWAPRALRDLAIEYRAEREQRRAA